MQPTAQTTTAAAAGKLEGPVQTLLADYGSEEASDASNDDGNGEKQKGDDDAGPKLRLPSAAELLQADFHSSFQPLPPTAVDLEASLHVRPCNAHHADSRQGASWV